MAYKVAGCAGHGGYGSTPGKRTPDGEYEWNFNDKVIRAFENELKKYEDVEFKRMDDASGKTDVPLGARTRGANDWGADLYLSFHHNANTGKWGTWTGIETYPGSSSTSQAIGKLIHDAMVKAYEIRDRGIKSKNLHITRATNMPSVLLEGGYMDSSVDIVKLRDDKVLENAGRLVAQVVAKHANLKLKEVKTIQVEKPQALSPSIPSDKGYIAGTIAPGETFVVGIKNTVTADKKWELSPVNQWVVAIKETEVLGYKPDASQYEVGKNLYEVKFFKAGQGWFVRGWVHGNFDYLKEVPVGYSEMYNEYKYQLRKLAKLYDKDGNFIAELPAGRFFFTKDSEAHPSNPSLIRCDRNETSKGDFSSIYGTYGWIDTRADEGTWNGEFGIRFKGDK